MIGKPVQNQIVDGRDERHGTDQRNVKMRGEQKINARAFDLERKLPLFGKRIMGRGRRVSRVVRGRSFGKPGMLSGIHEKDVLNGILAREQMRHDLARVPPQARGGLCESAIDPDGLHPGCAHSGILSI